MVVVFVILNFSAWGLFVFLCAPPGPCPPLAGAPATPFAFLQACLGLSFDPAGERVRFRQPRLPEFLDQVVIRKLRVGDSQFDMMLRRYGGDVSVNVLDRRGDGRIAITL